MAKRCKLNASFVVKLSVADIWTLHYVILIIIHPHYPVLLVSYLVLAEVGTTLALVARHLVLSLRFLHFCLLDVSIALRANTIHASIALAAISILAVSAVLSETIGFSLLRHLIVRVRCSMDVISFIAVLGLLELDFLIL